MSRDAETTNPVVGLVGYGRFGRAQGELLSDAGIPFFAFDPAAPVPSVNRATSLEDLIGRTEVIFVAVPVPLIESTIRAMRPSLRSSHIVADVGSIKVSTAKAMGTVFGAEIPWVGTHPLFGPLSLASGDRPLRVVICSSPMHPAAAARVRHLYEKMGCEVVEQTAAQHDRVMAHTHALTFFVAKGMIDAGVGLDVPFAPPSFQAFARTIETVRSDAGHLFTAIARDNPYAAEARHGLLSALSQIDRTLETTEDAIEIPPKDEASAPAGGPPSALLAARDQIDRLDRELVELLSRRVAFVKSAARAKELSGLPVLDAGREAAVFRDRRAWAEASALDPDSVEEVFRAIVTMSRRSQRDHNDRNST